MILGDLSRARRWLADHGSGARLSVSAEPDGLAAGALIARRVAGEVSFASDPVAAEPDRSGPLVIVDQGVRAVPAHAPVLYVDRHADPGSVSGTVLWNDRCAATSLLTWHLLDAPSELTWLAALGVLANHGESGLAEAQLTAPSGELHPLLELCLAAGQLRNGPVTAAFTMLADAATPQDALASPAAAQLRRAREAVDELAYEAARATPRLGPGAALIEIDVPARVEPRLAAAWARRLAPLPVVVANRGWRPHQVACCIRCQAPDGLDAWLAELDRVAFGDRPAPERPGSDGDLSLGAYERFAQAVLAVPSSSP